LNWGFSMRIVVLGTRGFPDVQGGVERHCENLYPRLVKLGCEVIVLARAPYTGNKEYSFQGVTIKPIACPKHRSLEAIVHTFKGIFEARMLRPDILHIHAIGPSIFVPLARLLGMKVVMTHHGQDYRRLKWGQTAKATLRVGETAGCVFANAVIAISKEISSDCIRRFGRGAAVIPNGVVVMPAERTGKILKERGIETGRYLLAVGRFVPEKGFTDLIEAFGIASKAMRSADRAAEWKLVIAGDADHEDEYSMKVKEKAMATENVVLTGSQKGRDLAELYSHAGLFVLPSYHEGLPIVLLEAMSYGLSCIVSDIAANREVALSGDRYFKPGDTGKLAEKILEFIARPFSEAEKKAQVDIIAREYNWDAISEATLKIYHGLDNLKSSKLFHKDSIDFQHGTDILQAKRGIPV
jgi:glycosyltransferase involved in cell wall biosynthesis